jgi:LPXTG-site transpeptidase (sortase) family protein
MGGIIDVTVRLIRAGRRTYTRKWSFLWLFTIAFLSSVAVLGQMDLLPEKPVVAVAPVVTLTANKSDDVKIDNIQTVPELPAKIEITKINLSANVVNPTTTGIEALDKELLKGAVRYPTSAKLGEEGNVVLFGHSSYLPVVKNQVYKTFNGIQKLAVGDLVIVYSSNTAYTYRVRSVAKESADNNTAIQLSMDDTVLTLVTCNSFATKQDRFVVTADFVESHSISK